MTKIPDWFTLVVGLLLKGIGPDELAEAARAAVRGEATLNPRVAARRVAEMRSAGAPGHAPNPFAELSAREHDVLRLIAERRSNAEIAEQLSLSEKTVKGHVSNILGKLHLADRTQAAVFAWREGLVRRDQAGQKSPAAFARRGHTGLH